MDELQRLQGACQEPPPGLVELAASCSRCRAETAVAGRVCRHCKLEELFWQWEVRGQAAVGCGLWAVGFCSPLAAVGDGRAKAAGWNDSLAVTAALLRMCYTMARNKFMGAQVRLLASAPPSPTVPCRLGGCSLFQVQAGAHPRPPVFHNLTQPLLSTVRTVQGRAFALYSKAREGAAGVTAEEAIRQAQRATLNRVGQGGLGEAAAGSGPGRGGGAGGEEQEEEEGGHHLLLGAGRRDDAVATTRALCVLLWLVVVVVVMVVGCLRAGPACVRVGGRGWGVGGQHRRLPAACVVGMLMGDGRRRPAVLFAEVITGWRYPSSCPARTRPTPLPPPPHPAAEIVRRPGDAENTLRLLLHQLRLLKVPQDVAGESCLGCVGWGRVGLRCVGWVGGWAEVCAC